MTSPRSLTTTGLPFLSLPTVYLCVSTIPPAPMSPSLPKSSPRTSLASSTVKVVVSGSPLARRLRLILCDAVRVSFISASVNTLPMFLRMAASAVIPSSYPFSRVVPAATLTASAVISFDLGFFIRLPMISSVSVVASSYCSSVVSITSSTVLREV